MEIAQMSVKEFYDQILHEYLVLKDYYKRLKEFVYLGTNNALHTKEENELRKSKAMMEELLRIKRRLESLEQTINYFELNLTQNDNTQDNTNNPDQN